MGRIGNRSFTDLVEENYGAIYRLALSMLGNEEEACDVTQETFERLWRHRRNVRPDAVVMWLRKTASNLSIDLIRRRKTKFEGLDDEAILADPKQDPSREAARDEERTLLLRALQRLPERYRMAVVLRDIERLAYAEISEITGRTENTVKSDVLRGRRMLRKILAPYYGI